ncbi:hypothetical protein YDYSY3_08300 [Paenibacillus chitinolyticus]|uniref:hypothetical protein n=1 Tax=Paenibacillus chitinolyticus TaxID=79263 RepID=UPI0026E4B49E|nr:hypothetical protein [Paenibacillus chitinolyticus]GKS09830.1 hypothetical protein YDYSY3_08300 [Paenibacillus chitinolyticus]
MVIQSARLNLRKTEINDLTFVLDIENDVENRSFIGQWTFEKHRDSLTDEDIIHLIIENKQGKKIGYAILSGLLDPNKTLCVKRITNKIKGFGYGKEDMEIIEN